MAKMNLLEMTQNILSAMDSDSVNSIGDTVESLQVAEVIVETYYELFGGISQPSREGLIRLEALADPTRPNYLKIPDNVKDIKWITYDGQDLSYVEPEQFVRWSFDRTEGLDVIDPTFLTSFRIFTNGSPTAWTTFDNEYIVFNGFDSAYDSTMQTSRSICWGEYDPVFEKRDEAYPPYLTGKDFAGLLAEAKSVCFANFKQVSSEKDEQRSRRQRVRLQNDMWRADQRRPYNKTPNYGRGVRGRGIGMDSGGGSSSSSHTTPGDDTLIYPDVNFKAIFLNELDYE